MLNEIEEFRAYTTFPAYKADRKNDTSYMGRFTFPMLLGFYGFQRILTILARGFLFEDGCNGYDRIDYARKALLAWCSVSTGRTQTQKKTPNQTDSGNQTNYAIYHAEFPDLVDEAGDGWLIRHVENIVRFVEAHPNKVRKEAIENAASLKKGFRKFWAGKVDHLQAVPFSENTDGKWGLRIEDALADALVLGPLKNRDFDFPEPVTRRLTERTPKGVPPEVSILLYKYYMIQRNLSRPVDGSCDTQSGHLLTAPEVPDVESLPFIVLPEQNVNTCFGNTAFSQKWVYALTGPIIERKTADGVCKYRITKALMERYFIPQNNVTKRSVFPMKKNPEGTLVVELNHKGIPDEELKPEAFSEHQLAVLAALNPADQEKIRKGYPITVVDMESQATLADFNLKNVRPDKWQIESLARALLPQIQEFYKDPENVKKAAAWAEERKKKQKPNRK